MMSTILEAITAIATVTAAGMAALTVLDARKSAAEERRPFLAVSEVQLLKSHRNMLQIVFKNSGVTPAFNVIGTSWHRVVGAPAFGEAKVHAFGIADPSVELLGGVELENIGPDDDVESLSLEIKIRIRYDDHFGHRYERDCIYVIKDGKKREDGSIGLGLMGGSTIERRLPKNSSHGVMRFFRRT